MHILGKNQKICDKIIFIIYSILKSFYVFQVGFHQLEQEKWVSQQKKVFIVKIIKKLDDY